MTSSPRNAVQCWNKLSGVLVRCGIRMIRAKNYETVFKFDKVMPRILWPLFPGRARAHSFYWICVCSRTLDDQVKVDYRPLANHSVDPAFKEFVTVR